MIDSREQKILVFIKETGACSSKEVHDSVNISVSYATLKRILTKLINENYLSALGKGKGTKYSISATFERLEA
jgi:predicted HTH transcriptional regulator